MTDSFALLLLGQSTEYSLCGLLMRFGVNCRETRERG